MAYQFFRFSEKVSRTFREYNIDFAVGPSGQNSPDDVMLVQLLLRIVYNENQNTEFATFFTPPADTPAIGVDGLFGPVTGKYIMQFKQQTRSIGVDLYPDNLMDPFRDNEPDSLGTISGRPYAFGKLMNTAARSDGPRFDSLIEHAATPELLKLTLQQSRDQALQYQQEAAFA
jgi:hypothetical protein